MSRRTALAPTLSRVRERECKADVVQMSRCALARMRECMAGVMRMTCGTHAAIPSPRAAGRGPG